MTIKAAVFSASALLDVVTLVALPRVGDYMQLRYQKSLAYYIREIVFLQPDTERWDIAILVDNPSSDLTLAVYLKALVAQRRERQLSKRKRIKAKEILDNPTPAWQEKKAAWERRQNGESRQDIAQQMGMTTQKVTRMIREWHNVLRDAEDAEDI